MKKSEILMRKIRKSADRIITDYKCGLLDREQAHEKLNELNGVCFAMSDFGLADPLFNPGEAQEYIHSLQERYTIQFV